MLYIYSVEESTNLINGTYIAINKNILIKVLSKTCDVRFL